MKGSLVINISYVFFLILLDDPFLKYIHTYIECYMEVKRTPIEPKSADYGP